MLQNRAIKVDPEKKLRNFFEPLLLRLQPSASKILKEEVLVSLVIVSYCRRQVMKVVFSVPQYCAVKLYKMQGGKPSCILDLGIIYEASGCLHTGCLTSRESLHTHWVQCQFGHDGEWKIPLLT